MAFYKLPGTSSTHLSIWFLPDHESLQRQKDRLTWLRCRAQVDSWGFETHSQLNRQQKQQTTRPGRPSLLTRDGFPGKIAESRVHFCWNDEPNKPFAIISLPRGLTLLGETAGPRSVPKTGAQSFRPYSTMERCEKDNRIDVPSDGQLLCSYLTPVVDLDYMWIHWQREALIGCSWLRRLHL